MVETGNADDLDQEELSDWNACLMRIAEGDRAAFTRLFAYFAPRIKSYVYKSGLDAVAAEEVAQEAMLAIWRKASSYDPGKAAAATWIFTIANYKKIDRLRRKCRPKPDMDDPAIASNSPTTPESRLRQAGNVHIIRQALAELPAEQRKVLDMAFLEECPHSEIAARLGIPLGTVKSRVRLGLNKLRSHISGEIGDYL